MTLPISRAPTPMQRRFRVCWLPVLLLLPASLRAQTGPLPADTALHTGVLPNGVRFYIRANHEPRGRAELRLAVNAGSVLEDSTQRGLAHLVEHMAFNGTRHFPRNELTDYLEGVGMRFGADVNAYTGFDETVYTLTLPTDSAGVLETGVEILRDWADGIVFDSAEVAKERGVVMEEWRLGQGAGSRIRDRQLPVLYGGRYAERLPIGDTATIRHATPAELRRFYREWYRPDLLAIVAVGDFDPARMEQLIRSSFASLAAPPTERARPDFALPPHATTRFSVVADPEATGSGVSLYLKRPARPTGTYGAYRRWLVESLAGSMLLDRLYERTQEPGSPLLDVSSFSGRLLRPAEALVLNASVPEGGTEAGVRALLTELRRAAEHGFTPSELQRAKTELLRRSEQQYAERSKATSAGFAAEYVGTFLYGGVPTGAETDYALVRRWAPDVSLAETDSVARGWTGAADRVVLATVPRKPGTPVPGEALLAAAVRRAEAAPVGAYRENVSDAPLVSPLPRPGRVTAERRIPELGVTEWTLGNGVRVVMKPTDFQNDEILLAARSPGGTSLVPDGRFTDARFATAAAQTGGVGRWDLVALGKRLAGKVASVGVSIGSESEGVSGVASPRDAETMFQLVYLYFTQPRRDSAAWDAYRARARALLLDRGRSPEAAFADTLQVVLAQHNLRARPPSAAVFDSLSLDRSLAVYRERFADAGDFTFYLVGNFRPDSIRPLVERYLGSLPSTGGGEAARDGGIRPPRGIVRRVVRRGTEPRARTQIVFSGPFPFARAEVHALRSMGDVLEIRLRDTLREEKSGTYGVGVGASADRDPAAEYRVAIGFGSDPARLDELTAAVFREIRRLQEQGPTPQEMAKVRETQRRELQTALRENNFWLGQLMLYDRYGWDPREIPVAPERIARLSAADVQRAARRYLDLANYVQVSLVPAGDAAPAPSAAAPR